MFKFARETVFRKEFDGTGILFDPDSGKTFSLNRPSRLICERLPQCSGESELLNRLRQKINPPVTAEADVKKFICQLESNGFLIHEESYQ